VRLLVDGRERSGFSYDSQTDHLVFDKMVRFGKGKHSVRIVATDESGNTATKRWTFAIR
jgi:hypothetical protein